MQKLPITSKSPGNPLRGKHGEFAGYRPLHIRKRTCQFVRVAGGPGRVPGIHVFASTKQEGRMAGSPAIRLFEISQDDGTATYAPAVARARISAILRLSAACRGSGSAAARASATAPARSGKRQHAIEGRLGEAVDDRIPVRHALPIDVAIALDHGRGLRPSRAPPAGCLVRLRSIMCSQRSTQTRSLA